MIRSEAVYYSVLIDSLRPLNQRGERVPAYALTSHRESHDFRYPCCLCAHDGDSAFTEVAIIMAPPGPYHNCWVATCAEDACGYFGKAFLTSDQ